MAGRMSNADRAMLREMWLCGVAVRDIAKAMGRPVGTVELRTQAGDIHGRHGAGTMRRSAIDRVRTGIDAMLPDIVPTCGEEVARVFLAMIAYGRRSKRIADLSQIGPVRAVIVMQAFDDAGIWRRTSGPPARWWEEGMDAVRADLARIATIYGGPHAA